MEYRSFTGKIKPTPASDSLKCCHCDRSFQKNRKADLTRHMRTHSDEKPYICPHDGCGKGFKQSGAMKTHYSSTHTKDKAPQCDICSKTFYDKSTLNRHKTEKHLKTSYYTCPYIAIDQCDLDKSFSRRPNFKAHMQSQHMHHISDDEANKYRVRPNKKIQIAAIRPGKVSSLQKEIPPAHGTIRNGTPAPASMANSSVSPSSYGISLSNPYPSASQSPRVSPGPQYRPANYGRAFSPSGPVPMSPPMHPVNINNSFTNGGPPSGFLGFSGAYSPGSPPSPPSLSPASLYAHSFSSSSSSSFGSGSVSHHSSPRSIVSRANSASPPVVIDPALYSLSTDSTGKGMAYLQYMAYSNAAGYHLAVPQTLHGYRF